MFTGLIEAVGHLDEAGPSVAGRRLRVTTTLAPQLRPGDSLAVNGVCLTIVAADGGAIQADVSPETLRVTTLGTLEPGAILNLERPLRADARVGGHFVQGHVDATGTIEEMRQDGDSCALAVTFPPELAPYIVLKGSIAVDGISLTVASLGRNRFGAQIIPFTFQHTNLEAVQPGALVNLECDMIGKYIVRSLELGYGARGGAHAPGSSAPIEDTRGA